MRTMTPGRVFLRWCSLLALLCSCTSDEIATQQGRSLRVVMSETSFTASDRGIQRRQQHEDDGDSTVEEVDVVTEVVETRGYDGEFDGNLIIPAIAAPETRTDPTPAPHPKKNTNRVYADAVPEIPPPIAAPHQVKKDPTKAPTPVPEKVPTPIPAPHHGKKDPTQVPTHVPKKDSTPTPAPHHAKEVATQSPTTVSKIDPTPTAAPHRGKKDPTQLPTTVPKKEATPTAAPHHDKNPTLTPTSVPQKDPAPTAAPHHDTKHPTQAPTPKPTKDPTSAPTTAPTDKEREADDDDQVTDTAEGTERVPLEPSSTPQVKSSNFPTKEPTEFEQKENQTEIIDDDLVARDNDVLEEELKDEETKARVFGGFGFLIAIVAMVFTAHQMSENPDGIFASLCRLAITIVSCVIKAVLMPFRSMLGHRGYHAGHMPISTTDPYRSHQLELT